jgi:uncharacterized protein (TIGR03067 family)
MARAFCISFFSFTLVVGVAAEEPDDKAMHGTWTPLSAELAGAAMPPAVVKSIVLKLDSGKYEVSVGGKLDRGTYTLDPAAKPKAMIIRGTEGPNRDKTFLCIYTIEGDTLRVCYDLSGKMHPTEFMTTPANQLYLVTYTRKKD